MKAKRARRRDLEFPLPQHRCEENNDESNNQDQSGVEETGEGRLLASRSLSWILILAGAKQLEEVERGDDGDQENLHSQCGDITGREKFVSLPPKPEIDSTGDNQDENQRGDDSAESAGKTLKEIIRRIARLEQGRGDKDLKGNSADPDDDGNQMKPVIEDSEEIHLFQKREEGELRVRRKEFNSFTPHHSLLTPHCTYISFLEGSFR